MGTRQYIGARYVPVFADPIDWDNTKSYEPLTIVMHSGDSYTSRIPVPVGADITDTKYWVLTGNYSGQLNEILRRIANLEDEVTDLDKYCFTPQQFGFVGDNPANDTAAIQAAIDAAGEVVATVLDPGENFVSGIVYFPAGTYETNDTLYVPDGVRIVGASRSSVKIVSKHNKNVIQLGDDTDFCANIILSHVSIYGNSNFADNPNSWSTQTPACVKAINCVRNCSIEDCIIREGNINISTEKTWQFTIKDCKISFAKNYNIYAEGITASLIFNNRIDWAENKGIYIKGSAGVSEALNLSIKNNSIQQCWNDAVYLEDCGEIFIESNFFEGNYRNAVAATYDCADINIVSNSAELNEYSFLIMNNFHTHGSSPNVDVYTAVRCNSAKMLNVIGEVVRDSLYYRIIDADNANVECVNAIGNATPASATEIVANSAAGGIWQNADVDGNTQIQKFNLIYPTFKARETGSNTSISADYGSYIINTDNGNRGITLGDSFCKAGAVFLVVNSGSNTLGVNPETLTINGSASITIPANTAKLIIGTTSAGWFTT